MTTVHQVEVPQVAITGRVKWHTPALSLTGRGAVSVSFVLVDTSDEDGWLSPDDPDARWELDVCLYIGGEGEAALVAGRAKLVELVEAEDTRVEVVGYYPGFGLGDPIFFSAIRVQALDRWCVGSTPFPGPRRCTDRASSSEGAWLRSGTTSCVGALVGVTSAAGRVGALQTRARWWSALAPRSDTMRVLPSRKHDDEHPYPYSHRSTRT